MLLKGVIIIIKRGSKKNCTIDEIYCGRCDVQKINSKKKKLSKDLGPNNLIVKYNSSTLLEM